MSKLAKFKSALTVSEAAALLSRLIGEDVTAESIETLYRSKRIGMIFKVNCQVFKLTEELSSPTALKPARCFEEAESSLTTCTAIYLPSETVYIRSKNGESIYRAIALRDSEGNFYALCNSDTPANSRYLNEAEHFQTVQDGFVTPEEIYKVADEANSDEQANPRAHIIKENFWCTGMDGLFNFYPGDLEISTREKAAARCAFAYVTDELEAMNLAASHFWAKFNIERPPLQKTVSAFIAEQLGMAAPNRKTDALAAAIRPSDAPSEKQP